MIDDAHDLLQEPVRSNLLGKSDIRRTGDRNKLSAGLQHVEELSSVSVPRLFSTTS